MALYSAIRRAYNKSIIPLALRSVASTSTSYFSAANAAVENGVCGGYSGSFSVPLLHYSTSAVNKKKNKRIQSSFDDILLQILDSEITFAVDSDFNDCVVDVPDGFPFKVQDKAGGRVIVLTRDYDEETINVLVDMPNARCENVENAAASVSSEEESEPQPSVPLSVTVSKRNGSSLEFDARAFPNRISICGMSIKESKSSNNQLNYRGPAFSLLNENLRKSIYEYLEVRGLTGSTANFLLEYLISKDSKEYLRWLTNIKKFVEN